MASSIVQYVVVRSDLISTLKWPVGAVIAQVRIRFVFVLWGLGNIIGCIF